MLELLRSVWAWIRENPWRLLYLLPYLAVPFLVVPLYNLLDYVTALLM